MTLAKRGQNQGKNVSGAKSVNPMGVSPDQEFSTEPLSQGANAAKKRNTK